VNKFFFVEKRVKDVARRLCFDLVRVIATEALRQGSWHTKLAADAGVFTCITKHNKGRLEVVSGEIK
jgi:hypothetical protein